MSRGLSLLDADHSEKVDCRWTGNDSSARNHNGVMKLAKSPVTLALSWKPDAESAARPVAVMRLDLLQLLSDGVIRLERPGEVRVRFVHHSDGSVLLQVNQQGPSITVGRA
jgi:hypothetical protein